jgi:hypothetical protein
MRACSRACGGVQQRCDPPARADAEYRASGGHSVAHPFTVTYTDANAVGGPRRASARPGYAASDIAC